MAEPQPAEPPPHPTAAEQKQEAAALSNLSTNTISEDDDSSASNKKDDHAALGAALSHLSVSEQKGATDGVRDTGKAKKEVKKIKVGEGDVKFLIEELEVSKKKATEMLQACDGDRTAAVEAFVVPSVKA